MDLFLQWSNEAWVSFPSPSRLKKAHYMLSTHDFSFEFYAGDQAEWCSQSIHMKDWKDKSVGDVKIHCDKDHRARITLVLV
jgi:hypothetical protein